MGWERFQADPGLVHQECSSINSSIFYSDIFFQTLHPYFSLQELKINIRVFQMASKYQKPSQIFLPVANPCYFTNLFIAGYIRGELPPTVYLLHKKANTQGQ
jgi:hypothetical protein